MIGFLHLSRGRTGEIEDRASKHQRPEAWRDDVEKEFCRVGIQPVLSERFIPLSDVGFAGWNGDPREQGQATRILDGREVENSIVEYIYIPRRTFHPRFGLLCGERYCEIKKEQG